LPYDPVAKKRSAGNNKRDHDATILAANVEVGAASGFGAKPGVGQSGVHLRYHTHAEYRKLSPDQKFELSELHKAKNKKDGRPSKEDEGKNPTSKSSKKQIASAVAKEVARQLKRDANEEDNVDAMIMSLKSASSDEKPPKKVRMDESTSVNTSALKSILCRVKNKNT